MWRTSSARRKSLPSTMRLPGPRRMGLRGAAMELFLKLFGDLLVLVYHCFDRTVIDQIEHGHHVFRAYFKHAVLRQYEKFSTFLRNELCSNNLKDFGLKKS